MKWGQEDLFPTNPDLADILGRTDFDFDSFIFICFLDPKFADVQVPDFQISRNLAWVSPSVGPGGSFSGEFRLCRHLGDTDFDFENLYFFDVLDPIFPDFWISRFLDSQIQGCQLWP